MIVAKDYMQKIINFKEMIPLFSIGRFTDNLKKNQSHKLTLLKVSFSILIADNCFECKLKLA